MKVIDYFDTLPTPTSVDENLLQGKGSVWKLYSATIVDKEGTLQWKLVGWNHRDDDVKQSKIRNLTDSGGKGICIEGDTWNEKKEFLRKKLGRQRRKDRKRLSTKEFEEDFENLLNSKGV